MADQSNQSFDPNRASGNSRREGGAPTTERRQRDSRRSRRRRRRTRQQPNQQQNDQQGRSHAYSADLDHQSSRQLHSSEALTLERPETVRSDAATVNSGSELEDFEVESIRSRESSRTKMAARESFVPVPPVGGKTNAVNEGDSPSLVVSSVAANVGQTLATNSSSSSEDKKPKAQPRGGGGGTETQQPATSRSSPPGEGDALETVNLLPKLAPGDDPQTQVKSSKAANEQEHASGSSLDVEIHSSASCNSLSYDEQTHHSSGSNSTARVVDDGDAPSGRRSPGGTVYIGRGARRYQGRYINVALRRFHQGGVHPDSLQSDQDDEIGALDDPVRQQQPPSLQQGEQQQHQSQQVYDERQPRRQQVERTRGRRNISSGTGHQPPPARRSRSRSSSPDNLLRTNS
ncbi:hypothetical protein ACA910_005249 [Epithemia clementina (nom. ined.)]